MNREQGLAGHTVEDIDVTQLGDLRHCIHRFALVLQRQEIGRRGQIPVPDIVVDKLKVPEPPARSGIQRQQAVGEQVFTAPLSTVKVIRNAAPVQVLVNASVGQVS